MNLYQYITSHEEQKNIFVKAQGGSGKTTQLRFIESKLIERAKKGEKIVPIYIDVKNIDAERPNPIFNEIHAFCGIGCDVDDVKDAFEKAQNVYVSSYQYYILIDALNEAINDTAKSKIIMDANALSKSTNCIIIVTSRVEEEGLNNFFRRVELQPLEKNSIFKVIEGKYQLPEHIQVGKVNLSLLEILQIPLFLTTFLKTFSKELDYSRLYDEKTARKAHILDAYRIKILEDLEPKNRRNIELNEQVGFVLNHYLPAVAFQMAKTNKFEIKLEDIEDSLNAEYFAKFIKGTKKKKTIAMFSNGYFNPSAIVADNFALIVDKEDVWQFTHHIWRDFFCALHVVNVLKHAKEFSELELHLDNDIRQLIGELYKTEDGLCECDFESKTNTEPPMSPIEAFLQNNKDLLNRNPSIVQNLIETSKVARNNRITMNFSGLDLTKTNFIGCEFRNSSFEESLISSDSFIYKNKSSITYIDDIYIVPNSNYFLVVGGEKIELWDKKTMQFNRRLDTIDDLYFTISRTLAIKILDGKILIIDKEANIFVFNMHGELIDYRFNIFNDIILIDDIDFSNRHIYFTLKGQLYYKPIDNMSSHYKMQTPKSIDSYIVTDNGDYIVLRTKNDVIYIYNWNGSNYILLYKISYAYIKKKHNRFHFCLEDFSLSYDNKYLLVHFHYMASIDYDSYKIEQIEKYDISNATKHETLLKYIKKIGTEDNYKIEGSMNNLNIPVGKISFVDGYIGIEKETNYYEKEWYFYNLKKENIFTIKTKELEDTSNRFSLFRTHYHLTNEELFVWGKEISIARFTQTSKSYYIKSHITSLSYSANNEYLVLGKATGEVSIWNMTRCQLVDNFIFHMLKIRSVVLSTTFNEIIIAYKDIDDIFILDAKTKRIKQQLKITDPAWNDWTWHVGMRLSTDESMLIITDFGKIIKIFERKNFKWTESLLLKQICDIIVENNLNVDNVYISNSKEYVVIKSYKKLCVINLNTNDLNIVNSIYYINDLYVDELKQLCVCLSSERDIIEIIDFSGQLTFFDCSVRWYVGDNCKAFLNQKTGEVTIINTNQIEPDSVYDYQENSFSFFKRDRLFTDDSSKESTIIDSIIIKDKLFIICPEKIKVYWISPHDDNNSIERKHALNKRNIANITTDIKINAIGSDFSKSQCEFNDSHMLFEELHFNGAKIPANYQIDQLKEDSIAE